MSAEPVPVPVPFPIRLDLARYRDKKLCPGCGHKLCRKSDDKVLHAAYAEKARQRFQEQSLPLCAYCYKWSDHCDTCDLPIHLGYDSNLGTIIMSQTTLAGDSDTKKRFVCTVCRAAENPSSPQ